MKYFVVVDRPAHEGWIQTGVRAVMQGWADAHPSESADYAVYSPRMDVWGEYVTREAAQEALAAYLDCPRARDGGYCYSHNK